VRSHPAWLSRQYLALSAAAVLSACLVAACSSSGSSSSGSTGSTSTSSPSNTKPILIGASLSLTGDFSADGQAFEKGYQLWASDVNSSGGLLGRQVQLKILNDNSSPTQVQTNYQTLFASDKVDLAFGPFSSLLTTPSASVAARYGYAMIEGAGGAPSVFASPANQSAHNIFDVSLPIEDELIPFVNWVASLPPNERPKTAAYPMADDPFADPPVQLAQQRLKALGVKTVYSKIFPAENASYKPAADQVAATGAQAVVLGSTDVPTVAAFMQAFEQQHYNPKMFICAAGPDQGAAFTSAVGKGNATGMMVPNGWYPGYQNAASQKMVQDYVAKYGGSASDINADVAEGYAVGQVAAQAVTATKGTDNAKIISYLHSGVTLSSVQGPVRFDNFGKNSSAAAFTFQWQQQGTAYKQILPVSTSGSVPIINPKPNWTS
jgi:branched-chain amino acid transport system substrate-binding protein